MKARKQLAVLPANSPSAASIKAHALRLLQQKRTFEATRSSLMQQSFNMEQTNFAIESLTSTKETVQAMQVGAKAMRAAHKEISVGKVEDLQDELADLMYDAADVQEALGRSYFVPDGQEAVDEDALEAELEAIQGMPEDVFSELTVTSKEPLLHTDERPTSAAPSLPAQDDKQTISSSKNAYSPLSTQ